MATGILKWVKLLLDLQDFMDEVTDAMDWILWSQEATGNVASGRAPPPSPMSPAEYQEALERTRDRMVQLPIPTFEARLPSTADVPATGFDATRSEIRSRINDLSLCVAETADAKSAISYFATLESALERQIEMLRVLAKVMWDLALKLPVVEVLAFQALDVENSYIPFVVETQTIVADKRKAAKDQLTIRLASVRDAANAIRNYLVVEAIDLRNALHRLATLEAEVALLQEAMVRAVAAKDNAQADVSRLETLRDAAQMDVEETQARLDSARQNVNQFTARISELEKQIAVEYTCPSSGVSWNDCTQPEHQQFKNAFLARRADLSAQVGQLRKELEAARNQVNGATSDLAKVQSTLSTLNTHLASARKVFQNAVAQVARAKEELTAKVTFVTEEKHRLRADIFAAENSSDKGEVEGLLTQIGGTP